MKTLIPTLLSAALLFTVATQASAQSNDSGRALVASNTLKLSADTESCGFITTVKEFIVPYAGVVRVKYSLKAQGSSTVFAQAGSAIHGCSAATSSATYQAEQCDLRVREGDFVRVSAIGTFDPINFFFTNACISNVRVFYNVVNATGAGRVIAD